MPEKQNFEFNVETKKILRLMIHSLYTNKDIAVRELISNASDACDKLRYEMAQNSEINIGNDELSINIEVDEDKKILSIRDNGIGMNRDDLIKNLGTIAKSGTQEFLEKLSKGKEHSAPELIGQFGVGFYSSFMIANRVEVASQKFDEENSCVWSSDGDGEFKIKKNNDVFSRGTKVILYLRDEDGDFADRFKIKHIVKTYSDHINFPIRLKMGTADDSVEVVNTGSALWRKNRSEITKEQYNDFYKYMVHIGGEPWMILHNKVEGNIEFTNLLFIPDRKTYDLYHPDRNTRIKLYIKKVFITEDGVQILPRFLRFIQGIVDSEDLPLNISRETLQYNNAIAKIQKALIKKIFSELAKKDESESEEYLKFWSNFGPVLKEGLCENNVNNDDLLDICKFYTSKAKDKPISLKTYLDRRQKEQKDIYYICCNSLEQADNSPQMEGFKSRDIEVLYLVDTVDDFWVINTNKYKDSQFKSVARANIDLDNLNNLEKEKDELEFDGEKKETKDLNEKENWELTKFFENILNRPDVKAVRISKKLVASPICLVADEQAMDIKLERFLLEQKQIASALARVVEINANHPIIKYIGEHMGNEGEKEKLSDMVKILYDEACIMEGEPAPNPADFAARLNKMLEMGMS
ncbi:MAG: molecular chaperone HtpG [Rickettsiales bacterium]|jgi:molecular chaperone HtpG|nr:molecular chaperone HtpG [Rickettsiales bacterium]